MELRDERELATDLIRNMYISNIFSSTLAHREVMENVKNDSCKGK